MNQTGPHLRIVRGQPSDEEIAALVVAVATLAARAAAAAPNSTSRKPSWSAPMRQVRGHLRAGPGAWRASALPR